MSSSVLTHEEEAPVAPAPDDDVRSAAVEAAIALYRRRAIHEVSLDDVAESAGLDVAAVRRRFPSINDLLVATITVWHGRRYASLATIPAGDGAVAYLRAVVVANVEDPALMRLLMALASIAATPGHPITPELQHQWVQFHAVVQRALVNDVEIGREPSTLAPVWGAEQLIAVYEGLQVQALMRPNMDLVVSYDRAVARLRDGWSTASASATWEL